MAQRNSGWFNLGLIVRPERVPPIANQQSPPPPPSSDVVMANSDGNTALQAMLSHETLAHRRKQSRADPATSVISGKRRNSRSRTPTRDVVRIEGGAAKKVQIVERNDPSKTSLIEQQAREIASYQETLNTFHDELSRMSRRIEEAEERALAAEQTAMEAEERRQAGVDTQAELAKKFEELSQEAERRVKAVEDKHHLDLARQAAHAAEMQKIAEDAKKKAMELEQALRAEESERQERSQSAFRGSTDQPTDDMEIGEQAGPSRVSSTEKGKEREAPPPRTPSNIPKPVRFQPPSGGGGPPLRRRRPLPPPPPAVPQRSEGDPSPGQFDARPDAGGNSTGMELGLALNLMSAKLDHLIGVVVSPTPQRAARKAKCTNFKTPRVRKSDSNRTKRCTWVRKHLDSLIGITKDTDILKFEQELYASNTPLKQQMEAFELDNRQPGPVLEPMWPNFDELSGEWNMALFKLFLVYSETQGYCDGVITEDDEDELLSIFTSRLESLRTVVKANRPKNNETLVQARARAYATHLAKLQRQRAHTRRSHLFNVRTDTVIENVGEELSEESREGWLENHQVISSLGLEGMSSDESDPEDASRTIFRVKSIPWRNPILISRLDSVDQDRNRTNVYGNRKGGTPPRVRRRLEVGSRVSQRRPPTGKPLNFYNPEWYEALSLKEKNLLDVKPSIDLLEEQPMEGL